MKTSYFLCAATFAALFASSAFCGTRHAGSPVYPTYDGRVMAGYQGWFHNRDGGVMFKDENSVRIDMWPDVS
nr:xylosidase [Kiritimatiellia bacterium]